MYIVPEKAMRSPTLQECLSCRSGSESRHNPSDLSSSEWPGQDVAVVLLFVHRQQLLGGNDVLARLATRAPTEAANWKADIYLVSMAREETCQTRLGNDAKYAGLVVGLPEGTAGPLNGGDRSCSDRRAAMTELDHDL